MQNTNMTKEKRKYIKKKECRSGKRIENTKLFGSRLRALRLKKDIKQEDLAKLCGVHTSTISAWELGKNTPRKNHMFVLTELFRDLEVQK